MSTHQQALEAVRTILAYIGEDPDREGLIETPERFLRAWCDEWGAGYNNDPENLIKTFPVKCDEMVLVRDIKFYSHCAHHLTPYYGTVTLSYLADNKVLGVSKLARIVNHFARRLTIQEQLTNDIADFIHDKVTKLGCGVILKGTHLCMVTRGVSQPEAIMITSALRGAFFDNEKTRSEFLSLANHA